MAGPAGPSARLGIGPPWSTGVRKRSPNGVESGFRQFKDLHVVGCSPMFYWAESKIRVHVFNCVLAWPSPISGADKPTEPASISVPTGYSPTWPAEHGPDGGQRPEGVVQGRGQDTQAGCARV